MLDSDVARLYKYETKNVNKAMKRNIERFPEDFCFQLTEEEKKVLRFQNGTLENQNGKGHYAKYLPYVYTEQGVAMLAGLLKNEIAVQASINIIKKAEGKILIIDNYIDDSILEMLSKKKKGVEVVILTSKNSNILKLDVQKFNKEYPALKIAKTDKFHDRFIIIDNKELMFALRNTDFRR